jgi:hypothetical protein
MRRRLVLINDFHGAVFISHARFTLDGLVLFTIFMSIYSMITQ